MIEWMEQDAMEREELERQAVMEELQQDPEYLEWQAAEIEAWERGIALGYAESYNVDNW